jgi:S-adenosyl-L-methionine hydrolase (adenosine-forming)
MAGSVLRNRCLRVVLTPVRVFASVKERSASPLQQRRPCGLRPRENPLPNAIITLTTDYGTNDHLVGTLKGVILKINPEATIVDITHNVAPFDLLDGALAIGSAYSYFPARTIHVVVVDPGVGTERRPLLVTAENQYFVAPDNGVLSVIYEREENVVARNVMASHYFLQPISKTFHGRDIFAPIAAWLSKGWQTASMGDAITDYKKFALPKPKATDGVVKGIVMRVDTFGNLVTNFRVEDLPESALTNGEITFQVGTQTVSRMVPTFASGNAGEPVAYLGSAGYVEIAVNKGNASRTLSIGRGTAVLLTK